MPEGRLVAGLTALGLKPGQVIYLGLDLGGIPLPAGAPPRTREAMAAYRHGLCAFVLDSLRRVVGDTGTILVPAFSYSYARHATPYEHETSLAELGPFTEWFRNQPGVIRSFHPLYSLCGQGPQAAAILEDVGKSAFGALSPFARLTGKDTMFVSLGAALAKWFTYAHHLEQLAGVNHAYHKAYTVPARRRGVEIEGPFLAFVRYLDAGVELAIGKLEERLRAEGTLAEIIEPGMLLQAASAVDVDRIGLAMLKADPCAFIETPATIHIDTPGAARQPDGRGIVTRFTR